MARIKVLITVKTYPSLSVKHQELVCTAGFREDGSWIRIYPIPFRKLDYEQRYKKYQWMELDLEKNTSDFRPESYRPLNFDSLKILDAIKPDGQDWAERRRIVLQKVYTNLSKLIAEAKDDKIGTSLAVFKPTRMIDFVIENDEREWDRKKLDAARQQGLFDNNENPFEVFPKLPFKFSYKFADDEGKESTLMIEDWEVGQLYWNTFKSSHSEDKAKADVRKKYWDDFALTKDLHFFLGTTREFHKIAPNPFIIIGTFHPKPNSGQMNLL